MAVRLGFPAHAGMDPRAWTRCARSSRLPRTRGDGPVRLTGCPVRFQASPHTRGWTLDARQHARRRPGFPAHAGMDPARNRPGPAPVRLPRTRGDGPESYPTLPASEMASPHTRGWTTPDRRHRRRTWGFPAHAGMDRGRRTCRAVPRRLPRTRGDGPPATRPTSSTGPASPHTRGWTQHGLLQPAQDGGFPAHAGMDLEAMITAEYGIRLPRTRGDGPWSIAPRGGSAMASPHTRGWTRALDPFVVADDGFPAHAGMDRWQMKSFDEPARLPRTRGDGPNVIGGLGDGDLASPHTRGWTDSEVSQSISATGFPAHAGMDPTPGHGKPDASWLPRTRGDGPLT